MTPELNCAERWLPAKGKAFQRKLFPELEELACQSSAIARGLIRQLAVDDTTSGRFGLAGRFVMRLDKRNCEGLSSLPQAVKDQIRDLKDEEEERRGQSGAGKPAGAMPALPNPPRDIAPETP